MPPVHVKFVRRPSEAVLQGIITLYRAHGWWDPADTPATLRRLVAGSHCFAVAVSGGRIIGIGRAISDGASDAYIQDIAVLKAHRKSGIGSTILLALSRRLSADGIKWVALIAQDNSFDFYRKAGFRVLAKAHPMLSAGSHV